MTGSPVRIGLVGYGRGGRYFHAPLITAAEGCELSGVVVRSAERRTGLAADHPGVQAYGSLAELADGGIEAVVVTTPLDSHVPLVREAVDRGLPVVCDKPFAVDAATARDTVLAAERAGILLSVYQNRRWDADFLTVARMVGSGELGDVVTFESRMEQYPQPEGLPMTGGGALLDLGSHAVDQARFLLGPVGSVYAELHHLPEDSAFDDRFFLALQHEGGASSRVIGHWALQGDLGQRFRVDGTSATLVVPDDDGQTAGLLAGRSPVDEQDAWGTVPESRWGRVYRRGVATPVPAERGSWSVFYTGFARAVRGEAPPPVDPWDAVATLEVLDAARRSATTGQVVSLRPVSPPR
jgi:predicted dehydrogenase